MTDIAVLGCGVESSGVAEVLERHAQGIEARCGAAVRVRHILDVQEFPDSPHRDRKTDRMADILSTPSIGIVVETIGGATVALELTRQALRSGRHVVTANSELVAAHGPELLELAAENHVQYRFEASTGAGIPVFHPLEHCPAANSISRVTGILNGASNYILKQMHRHGTDFAVALADAQQQGYAAADPAADIEGLDAARKIAILSSMAYETFLDYRDVHTEGIAGLCAVDMAWAEKLGGFIRLVAESKRTGNGILSRVSPVIIRRDSPLACVDDMFQAILVEGDLLGEALFCARVPEKRRTASALVADVIDLVGNPDAHVHPRWQRTAGRNAADPLEDEVELFVRARTGGDNEGARRMASRLFGQATFFQMEESETKDEIAFLTGRQVERELRRKIGRFAGGLRLSDVEPGAAMQADVVRVLRFGV